MKPKSLILIICVVVMAAICLGGCGDKAAQMNNESTRIVKDMQGTEVTIPAQIDRYAVAWTGDFDIAAMIDNCEHICAYPETSLKFPMVMEIYPQLTNCVPLPKINVSCESILETGAQVVFLRKSDYPELTQQLEEAAVPVIDLNFENYDDLINAVYIFADVMNTDEARNKAKDYDSYVHSTIEATRHIVDNQNDDISVLNFRDATDYIAYSPDRLVGSWAGLCNIKYSLDTGGDTNNVQLTAEQIIELDPDYIFFTFPDNKDVMLNDPRFQNMKAIKNGNVYDAPAVLNSFAVNGAEAVLQIKWAASLMWPDAVDYDLEKDAQDFYKKYYNLDFTNEEIHSIIWGSTE